MDASGGCSPNPAPSTSKKKYEDKVRRKDPRSWENILKSFGGAPDEQKLTFIEIKYNELYDEYRRLHVMNQQLFKQLAAVEKERDHNQAELAKSIIARARLENLSRELQKQNKQIKEENMAKIKEEEACRKELSLKFSDKLSDINNMMDENKEKNEKLRDENIKMTSKLGDLFAKFQQREQDVARMTHQLDLERKVSEASLAKAELELKAEKEIHAKETAVLKNNLAASEANCAVLLERVKGLQDHISVFENQYQNFENTMSKSAKVFDNFKSEIANMNKQVRVLEQEAQKYKDKFHDSMKALVEMSELKKNQDGQISALERKNDKLQKLCRQLQVDRGAFLKLLQANSIEVPNTTLEEKKEEETVPKKKTNTKLTAKEKNLEDLKSILREKQNQLYIAIERNELKKTDEPSRQVIPIEDDCVDLASNEEKVSDSPTTESVSSQEALLNGEQDGGTSNNQD